jgi:hypothetical protein
MHGIYLFGGICGLSGLPQNDIYRLRPNVKHNAAVIGGDYEYKPQVKPWIQFLVEPIETTGRPPCPRYQHSQVYFDAQGTEYLVVHGGRNDLVFN